jgi:hypothetical protein
MFFLLRQRVAVMPSCGTPPVIMDGWVKPGNDGRVVGAKGQTCAGQGENRARTCYDNEKSRFEYIQARPWLRR